MSRSDSTDTVSDSDTVTVTPFSSLTGRPGFCSPSVSVPINVSRDLHDILLLDIVDVCVHVGFRLRGACLWL